MILLLSLGGLMLFSIPVVQTYLVNRFTQKMYQNLETEMKVEGVAIGFDGSVNLASFYIADHHSDTLFYAKNFKTDLYSLGQWLNGNLFFSLQLIAYIKHINAGRYILIVFLNIK